ATQTGKWQVSTAGGSFPRWRSDGRELFYISADNKLTAVDVKPGATFESGTPKALFEMPYSTLADDTAYDVSADGQRILLCLPPGKKFPTTITVVLNWTEELKPQSPSN